MPRDKQRALDLVLAAVMERNGRTELPCVAAFRLAEEHGITLDLRLHRGAPEGREQAQIIGEICDEQGITIVDCQLRYFP